MLTRTIVLALIAIAILVVLAIVFIPRLSKPNQVAAPDYWPTQGWRSTTPEEQGIDSAKLADGLLAIREQDIPVDGLFLIRDGGVILDAVFDPYDGSFPHDVASVTKSITTTLIGIAAGQGKLDLDDPLVSFFPDRAIANLDARKEKITLRHMVTNTNGFKSLCVEGDIANIQEMQAAPDWVQFALDREVVKEPGSEFCYDSPGMHLLSAVLQETTGMTEYEFARKYLFEPLGIHETAWKTDPQGYTQGWGDLHLKPEDAAKIGFLFLHNGMWEGQQIVPEKWVQEAVKPQIQANAEESYGYGWWVEEGQFAASGRGGQKIIVIPAINVIMVSAGAGYEYDQIDPYISGSVVDLEKALPANPEGIAQLDAALETVKQPKSALPTSAQPDPSLAASERTYKFSPNGMDVETVTLDFRDPQQAMMAVDLTNAEKLAPWPIGLDGKYRLAADGQATRGYWADPTTFVFEIFDADRRTYAVHFEGDRVVLESRDLGISAEGQLENP